MNKALTKSINSSHFMPLSSLIKESKNANDVPPNSPKKVNGNPTYHFTLLLKNKKHPGKIKAQKNTLNLNLLKQQVMMPKANANHVKKW